MKILKNVFVQAILIAIVLTALSYGVGLLAGWVTALSWLEVFAVFTSYASTYLCVKQKRFNYVFGAISSGAYCYLFFTAGLLASTVLNAALAVWLIYGWFRWRSDAKTLPVTSLLAPGNRKWIPAYVLGSLVFYGVVLALVTSLGGTLAVIDSVILVFTVLAQILLDNKKIETWPVWVIVNVAAIYVYFHSGLFLVGVQYIFFLLNTLYGYYEWYKSKNAIVPPSPATGDDDLDIFRDLGFTDIEAREFKEG